MNAHQFTTPKHLDRSVRLIRIEALQSISFKTQIDRDWDEIARDAVEGRAPHERCKTMRFNPGE